jgi:hypothetical protein
VGGSPSLLVMGLFRRKKQRTQEIEGVATVMLFGIDETTTATNESSHQHHTKGSLTLQVVVPGSAPRTVVLSGKFPSQQFPSLGQELPVRVSPTDPDDVEILWDRVPTIVERMTLLAAQAREAQRTGQQVGPVHPPTPPVVPPPPGDEGSAPPPPG